MSVKKTLCGIFVLIFVFAFAFIAHAETASTNSEGVESPKEAEMGKSMDVGRVVFLGFINISDPDIVSIKSEINSVASNFSGAVDVVYVNSDDKVEDKFREKVKVSPDVTAVFIVVPPGRAVAKLEGKDITKTNLMRALTSACGGGGCGSGCK